MLLTDPDDDFNEAKSDSANVLVTVALPPSDAPVTTCVPKRVTKSYRLLNAVALLGSQ